MYAGELVTVLQGHQNAAGHLTPGRVVTCHKQIGDHGDGHTERRFVEVSQASRARRARYSLVSPRTPLRCRAPANDQANPSLSPIRS